MLVAVLTRTANGAQSAFLWHLIPLTSIFGQTVDADTSFGRFSLR
jgi:hypothetical protein